MRIFISSVIYGLQDSRDAASSAAQLLGHEVRRCEDFGAFPATPQQACLAGIRWSEVTILILGGRYGHRQLSGLSATHEEYREARGSRSVLAFIQNAVDREPEQDEFIREVQAWTTGVFTSVFDDVGGLRDAVVRALHDLELSRRAGEVDEGELLDRARRALGNPRGSEAGILTVVVAGGPHQQIIRPSELENPVLVRALQQDAIFGDSPIFDPALGSRSIVRDDLLYIEQDGASVSIGAEGTVRVARRCLTASDGGFRGLSLLVEEDVGEGIQRALRFSAWVLDRVDPTHRLTDVVPVVSVDRGHLAWLTRAEYARSPNSIPMATGDRRLVAELAPARRHRAALTHDRAAVVEDLVALLRRRGRVR